MSIRKRTASLMLAAALLPVTGCAGKPSPSPSPSATTSPPSRVVTQRPVSSATPSQVGTLPELPGKLQTGADGEPTLKVYLTKQKSIEEMPIETYLEGVLAGEMKNDWPLEALTAQAIIARTFALKFIEDKGGSMYEGADVSTDVKEAQAYNAQGVNERVRQAIEETRGMVIAYRGELTYTWFHAHAGGITAQAKEGLEWEGEEPPYIQSIESSESDKAPKDSAEWTASFPMAQVEAALSEMGFNFKKISSIKPGEKGPSGRTITFDIDGTPVTAPSLRVRLDPSKFKSTLITSAGIENGNLVIRGKGYGHGVGMSQWGAYGMADQGKTAEEIIEHYYTDVEVIQMW